MAVDGQLHASAVGRCAPTKEYEAANYEVLKKLTFLWNRTFHYIVTNSILGSSPEVRSNPSPHTFFQIQFNNILPSSSRYAK